MVTLVQSVYHPPAVLPSLGVPFLDFWGVLGLGFVHTALEQHQRTNRVSNGTSAGLKTAGCRRDEFKELIVTQAFVI